MRAMTAPVRVQLRRAKGWRMPENTVVVARPSQWGNPFTAAECGSTADAVAMFEHDVGKAMVFHPKSYEAWIAPLRGKNLACWCAPGQPCHADVLLDLANRPTCEEVA